MPNDDPSAIRSIAVRPEAVVDAFVYTRENPGTAVLRLTRPFHGRMCARLHVYRADDAPETGAIHVQAADLLEDRVVEAYPTLEPIAADGENPIERHAAALESWREQALEAVVDSVDLAVAGERTRVEVRTLA